MRKYELQSNRSRDNDQSRNIDVGRSFKVKASDWFSKSDGGDFTGRVLYSQPLNSSFLSLYRLFVAEARRLQSGWSICWKNLMMMLFFHIVNLRSPQRLKDRLTDLLLWTGSGWFFVFLVYIARESKCQDTGGCR